MHYSLPPALFKRGKESACFVAENLELSEQDRKFIASIYPKQEAPMVVSGVPADDRSRAAPPSGRRAARTAQALVKRYEELLKQSGIEAGKARELVAEFRKSTTGK